MPTRTDDVFDLLDRWRHLPKYQLERRADIFFALYIQQFLAERRGIYICPQLVPEFPIHLQTIGRNVPGDSSCNVDYFAMGHDHKNAYLLELKTEKLSRRVEQDEYLQAAREVGLAELINGVLKIAAKTKKKSKYLHLLCLLETLQMVSLPAEIRKQHQTEQFRGLTALLRKIKITIGDCPMQIMYIQPHGDGGDAIGFDEIAEWLGQFNDAVSVRFRQSLSRWANDVAGTTMRNQHA